MRQYSTTTAAISARLDSVLLDLVFVSSICPYDLGAWHSCVCLDFYQLSRPARCPGTRLCRGETELLLTVPKISSQASWYSCGTTSVCLASGRRRPTTYESGMV